MTSGIDEIEIDPSGRGVVSPFERMFKFDSPLRSAWFNRVGTDCVRVTFLDDCDKKQQVIYLGVTREASVEIVTADDKLTAWLVISLNK